MAEDDLAALSLAVAPTAENAFRSVATLETARGARVSAELVTAFVRRSEASNRSLRGAEMDACWTAQADHPDGRRARRLRARGRAARDAAVGDASPPIWTHRVLSAVDFNGVGLLYFANLPSLFAAAEHACLAPFADRFAAIRREIHYFGNADCGETLDVSARVRAAGLAASAELVVEGAARRGGDGRVIATCETTLRVAPG